MSATRMRVLLCLSLALSAVACAPQQDAASDKSDRVAGVRQTQFPGQVTAGGKTSGQLMQQAGALKDNPDPEGTPGIPQGSGGNTGGSAMSGEARGTSPVKGGEHRDSANESAPAKQQATEQQPTTEQQAATEQQQPAQAEPERAPDAKSAAKSKEEAKAAREKRELEAAMDDMTARWQARAASNAWEPLPPPPVDTTAGVAGQPGSVPPQYLRTEKRGNAPQSADKKPAPSPGTESGTPDT